MPDPKKNEKFGWDEDDFTVVSPVPADPFAELQEEIDKVDQQLRDAPPDEDEDEE